MCLVVGDVVVGGWWPADGSAVVVSIVGEGAVAAVVTFAVVAVRDKGWWAIAVGIVWRVAVGGEGRGWSGLVVEWVVGVVLVGGRDVWFVWSVGPGGANFGDELNRLVVDVGPGVGGWVSWSGGGGVG